MFLVIVAITHAITHVIAILFIMVVTIFSCGIKWRNVVFETYSTQRHTQIKIN